MVNNTLLEDYRAGKIVLVNKPLNWTSFDVVNKIRWHLSRALQIKKIKVGHAGTLDPLADGLLIICIGKATKMIEQFQELPKTYDAHVGFGATTPSYDMETEVNRQFPVDHITKDLLLGELKSFEGEQEQFPPIFSAKKIQGKPAYSYARKDKKIDMPSRKVNFYEIKCQKFELQEAFIRITCSKGTYIRSFAHDLGKKLNSGGYLKGLTRAAIGPFLAADAWNIKTYQEYIDSFGNN